MREQFDIAPRRKRAGVLQTELAEELNVNPLAIGAIEDGRIGIDTETYDRIHEAITRIESKKGKEKECEKEAALV